MKVYHAVVNYDSSIPDIIVDIQHIRRKVEICGATEDMLEFLLAQLEKDNV